MIVNFTTAFAATEILHQIKIFSASPQYVLMFYVHENIHVYMS